MVQEDLLAPLHAHRRVGHLPAAAPSDKFERRASSIISREDSPPQVVCFCLQYMLALALAQFTLPMHVQGMLLLVYIP